MPASWASSTGREGGGLSGGKGMESSAIIFKRGKCKQRDRFLHTIKVLPQTENLAGLVGEWVGCTGASQIFRMQPADFSHPERESQPVLTVSLRELVISRKSGTSCSSHRHY